MSKYLRNGDPEKLLEKLGLFEPGKQLLTTGEVAEVLGLGRVTVWRMARDKVIPSVLLRSHYRIDRDELIKYIRNHYRPAR